MKLEGKFSNGAFEIVTGVIDFNIVAVNPTLAELNELGVNFKTEPEYLSANPETNAKKVRIDFWIKPVATDIQDKLMKHTFFLEEDYKLSQAGKNQYINNSCQSSWGMTESDLPDWMDKDGIRKAYIGEADFMDFLQKFSGVKKIVFDNFNALFNGNVSEIRDLIKIKSGNSVQLLAIEKNGYQSTFTRYCMRGGNTNMTRWQAYLDKNNPDINYQNSLSVKIWQNQAPEIPTSNEDNGLPAWA